MSERTPRRQTSFKGRASGGEDGCGKGMFNASELKGSYAVASSDEDKSHTCEVAELRMGMAGPLAAMGRSGLLFLG